MSKRKVKCKATGKEGIASDFFKGINGYFASEEIYNEYLRKKTIKSKLLSEIMYETLGHPREMKTLTILLKKINEIEKAYDIKYITETYRRCKDNIARFMKGSNDFMRVSYISAVICNNIKAVTAEMKRNERAKELLEAKSDGEETKIIDIDEVFNKNTIEENKKDMSKWLEE